MHKFWELTSKCDQENHKENFIPIKKNCILIVRHVKLVWDINNVT